MMKFSALARAYDRISSAKSEPQRVRLLAELFRRSDKATLEALAHFTTSEIVAPSLSDQLGIGPGTIRAALANMSGKDTDEIDAEVKQSGDMSEVVATAHPGGVDALTVAELWRRTNRAVERNEDRLKLVESIFKRTTPNGAKYFTRMVLNQMRIGVGVGTLMKARLRHLYKQSH